MMTAIIQIGGMGAAKTPHCAQLSKCSVLWMDRGEIETIWAAKRTATD